MKTFRHQTGGTTRKLSHQHRQDEINVCTQSSENKALLSSSVVLEDFSGKGNAKHTLRLPELYSSQERGDNFGWKTNPPQKHNNNKETNKEFYSGVIPHVTKYTDLAKPRETMTFSISPLSYLFICLFI